MKYDLAQHSMQGARPTNQDRVGCAERDNAVLMVLADGLGGHAGGEIAAELFTQSLLQAFRSIRQPVITQPSAFLALSILQAHKQIAGYSKTRFPDKQPRTTCVVCLVQNGYAYWAHVGDSRLYHFHNDRLLKRTIDDSAIERLRQNGLITEEDMQKHPNKGQITRCVGGPRKPSISLGEETRLEPGDTLLLCTDGVWEGLSAKELVPFLNQDPLDEGIEEMLHAVEKKMGENCDNISAIVLRWQDEVTTHPPLQSGKATTVNQDTLWQRAQSRNIHNEIRSENKSRTEPKANAEEEEQPQDPKARTARTIQELEDYLSRFNNKL